MLYLDKSISDYYVPLCFLSTLVSRMTVFCLYYFYLHTVLSFDKYIQLWNSHQKRATELCHYPPKIPYHCPLGSQTLLPHLQPGQTLFSVLTVSPFLECHINGLIQLFGVWLPSLSKMLFFTSVRKKKNPKLYFKKLKTFISLLKKKTLQTKFYNFFFFFKNTKIPGSTTSTVIAFFSRVAISLMNPKLHDNLLGNLAKIKLSLSLRIEKVSHKSSLFPQCLWKMPADSWVSSAFLIRQGTADPAGIPLLSRHPSPWSTCHIPR